MSDFVKLPLDKVIKEGQTIEPRYCDKQYVVYFNAKEKRQKVRINTYYLKEDNVIKLCRYYDRGLCDTIEEYEKLDSRYIEEQAYGSWMDGAR